MESPSKLRPDAESRAPRAQNPGFGGISVDTACWLGLGCLLLAVLVLRLRLLDIPLERDEGDYAYFAMLMTQGVSPVDEIVRIRFPLTSALYAIIITAFGHSAAGVHAGLLVVNLASLSLLFLIGRKMLGPVAGLMAAAFLGILDLSPTVHGLSANREHFLIAFALAGFLVLERAIESRRGSTFLFAGVLMGLAFLVKQHGAAFILFGGLYLVSRHIRWSARSLEWRKLLREGLAYSLGVFLCYGLVCLLYAAYGEFDRFWYRTVVSTSSYASTLTWEQSLPVLMPKLASLFDTSRLIFCLSIFGCAACHWSHSVRQHAGWLRGFALFSALAVAPGFYFRSHYWILLMPAAALAAAAAVVTIHESLRTRVPPRSLTAALAGLVILALALPIAAQREYLLDSTPAQANRLVYPGNPFVEAVAAAEHLKERTHENDRILVLGSEPEILFYAARRSVTRHVYMYDLMQPTPTGERIQGEVIAAAEQHEPKYVVFVRAGNNPYQDLSWKMQPDSSRKIVDWWNRYQTNYRIEAVWAQTPEGSEMLEPEVVKALRELPPFSVALFRRQEPSSG